MQSRDSRGAEAGEWIGTRNRRTSNPGENPRESLGAGNTNLASVAGPLHNVFAVAD